MIETDKTILPDNKTLDKIIASLPVGYSVLSHNGTTADMLRKRGIPFEIRDGYIVLGPIAARWFSRQFGGT